ncbi:MAG: acylphosphatase [Alphaproteobacteria bacterium]|nr:acylphosphatase [Alphaproteobacteria bacterium]
MSEETTSAVPEPPADELEGVHLFISGKVQGVWYRACTQQRAVELGLTGWVRNLYDGRVEAVAEGPHDALQALIDWCHRGPDLARVVDVETEWVDFTGRFDGFEVAASLR